MTAPLLATRDALVAALRETISPGAYDAGDIADYLLASGVVRDPATLADDLKKFDVRREWGYVQSDAADADVDTILSNVQRFLEAHIDRALAAALTEDPS